MRREFCCSNCGLIWFGEEGAYRAENCPECNSENGIYACDTFGYAYAIECIIKNLKDRGSAIHYAQDHSFFGKNNFKHI